MKNCNRNKNKATIIHKTFEANSSLRVKLRNT